MGEILQTLIKFNLAAFWWDFIVIEWRNFRSIILKCMEIFDCGISLGDSFKNLQSSCMTS